jgi:hypothetical protein
MPNFVRVKNKKTGTKTSVSELAVRDVHEVLKGDAVDAHGKPLPAEYKTTATKAASASTSTSTTTKEL